MVQNALALYSVQFAEYLLPMLTIPYLARVLQPASWGLVAYAQNFSYFIILVVEYGFGFSATREISRRRDSVQQQAEVVSGVVGANALLLAPAILVVLIARFSVPEFRLHPGYLWLSLAIALTQGIRPFWYFQGIEQMKGPAFLNMLGRLFYTVGIFAFVKTEQSAWLVLVLQAFTTGAVTILITVRMYRTIPFLRPNMARSREALKAGWAIFLSRSANQLYTTANTFILGIFAATTAVAYFAGAERVILAVTGLMTPITQALYPRMAHIAANNREKATDAISKALLVFGILGLLTGLFLIAAAPWVVRILLGKSYGPAVGILRVASLVVPMVAMSNILGMQWMLPFGMDKAFNRISLAAGLLCASLGLFLAPAFGPLGTAWSVVAAQTFVTGSMLVMLIRSKRKSAAEIVP